MSGPPYLTLAESWAAYLTFVIPKDAPAVQCTESRRAFYAGAEAVLAVLRTIDDDVSEEAGVALLNALTTEIETFLGEIRAGRA